ncbi:MAG: hypothetical protein PF637_08050 [Spirochaetes bacterium]|jgi:hypothetical protein|nr:hypothetical protein [Spirochaetota bacterium]
MKADKDFTKLVAQSLSESIDQRSMVHLAREIMPEYNIESYSNLPSSLDIPRLDVARQIVADMNNFNLLIPFVNVFFSIQSKGYKGRKYKISKLRSIVVKLFDMGFSIDPVTGQVYEDPQYRISKNWGVLQEGIDYPFTFVWYDIVESSIHLKKNSHRDVLAFYQKYHNLVRSSTESRNGRIWHIEGDGILTAFHFGDHSSTALFSGIEVLHSLYKYNLFENVLDNPIKIRIGLNTGVTDYIENHDMLKTKEPVKDVINLEKISLSDTIVATNTVMTSVEGVLASVFEFKDLNKKGSYFVYDVKWEN